MNKQSSYRRRNRPPVPDLEIVYQDPRALTPDPRNPRKHTNKHIAQLKASLVEFDFVSPILVDAENVVVAHAGCLQAAIELGFERVPTVCIDHLSPEQIRAYRLADNRLADLSQWDDGLLALELGALIELDIDFDITVTGFEIGDIDFIIEGASGSDGQDELDAVPPTNDSAVTHLGDIWAIGPHRLICGDARFAETYQALLGEERAQMVFTDPPFNVPIRGHVSGLGKVRHCEFIMGSGEMSEAEFIAFLTTVFEQLAAFSADGTIHYQCIDWRHLGEMLTAGKAAYNELKNVCVWAKSSGGMGSLYRSQHELVFVFKSGTAPHVNNVELGKHGRYRTNLWSYAGANSFGRTRDADLAAHPTVKNVAMVADAILDCSHPKGIILDPFAGSGTTLAAAHKTRRVGYGIELDPIYCDVILQRLQKVTRVEPVHLATGLSLSAITRERAAQGDAHPQVETREAGE